MDSSTEYMYTVGEDKKFVVYDLNAKKALCGKLPAVNKPD